MTSWVAASRYLVGGEERGGNPLSVRARVEGRYYDLVAESSVNLLICHGEEAIWRLIFAQSDD